MNNYIERIPFIPREWTGQALWAETNNKCSCKVSIILRETYTSILKYSVLHVNAVILYDIKLLFLRYILISENNRF